MKGTLGYIISTLALIIVVVFGIFEQNIASFFEGLFPTISIIAVLSIVTFSSIVLFIEIPIFSLIYIGLKDKMAIVYALVSIGLGIPISMWSIFVWLCGWGNDKLCINHKKCNLSIKQATYRLHNCCMNRL